jgi:DNA polymerase I-like protein with 3'-5' exonuclease and polymerase domains
MKIIRTHEVDLGSLNEWERDQIYNGLDVCVTHDAFKGLDAQRDNVTTATYDLSKCLQGPVIEMACRGVLVDQARRHDILREFYHLLNLVEARLERIVYEGVGLLGFNWRSHADLRRLFYDRLDIPPIYHKGKVSVDEAAREELRAYPIAEQIINHIDTLVTLGKRISVLKTGIDADGRFRTSYNIAGTKTGRFSSSESVFDTGGNLQNIEESLRSVFVADPGYKFVKADARSGESFCVGAIEWNLFEDGKYLDLCETGDPHTAVARVCWPKLPWTGDLARDKKIAEQPYYRGHSHRFMCKKIGHGTHYGGREETLAQQARLPVHVVSRFQRLYLDLFPAHKQWHLWVEEQVKRTGQLTSLLGRRRKFYNRRNNPKTIRDAIAYDPQSSLSDIVNLAMLKIWRAQTAIVMMTDHDALTFMYPEREEERVVAALREQLVVPVALAHGRELRIPYDIEVGWNKAHASADNPDGLVAWPDTRRARTPQMSPFDRTRRVG